MKIEKNMFYNNRANELGGAILFANKIPKKILDNTFLMNKAHLYYGNNYASDPYRIIFENEKRIYMKLKLKLIKFH